MPRYSTQNQWKFMLDTTTRKSICCVKQGIWYFVAFTKNIEGTKRNITADNWFSSFSLVHQLNSKQLTFLGAIRKTRQSYLLSSYKNKEKLKAVYLIFRKIGPYVCLQTKQDCYTNFKYGLWWHNCIHWRTAKTWNHCFLQ